MNKILSKWYIFVLTSLLAVVSFVVASSAIAAPKAHEKISFFIGAYDAKVEELNQDINKSNDVEGLKVIEFDFHYTYANDFGYIFSIYKETDDFYILPLDFVEKNKEGVLNYSANIRQDYVNSFFENKLEYYVDGEDTKGIKMYDSLTDTGYLKNYIDYVSKDKDVKPCDYYLFFAFDSINIGTLNHENKTTNAFQVIQELMEL